MASDMCKNNTQTHSYALKLTFVHLYFQNFSRSGMSILPMSILTDFVKDPRHNNPLRRGAGRGSRGPDPSKLSLNNPRELCKSVKFLQVEGVGRGLA